MNYEEVVRKIIAQTIKTTESITDYDANQDLQNIGMDSIIFVRIVVEIENEFDIEFPDEKLNITEAGTIKKLCDIIESAES